MSQIKIIAKVRACDDGFLPMIVVNGRETWNWRGKGYDREVAASMAMAEAQEERAKYVGDWAATVEDCTNV